MKRIDEIKDWTRCYETALRVYVREDAAADAKTAVELGRRAATLGLETLDVAKVHERTLCAALLSNGTESARQNMSERAQHFFSETLVPIERTHPAARKAEVQVKELTHTLKKRKREAAASIRSLKRGIARRESAEAAFRAVDLNRKLLLKESHKLQQRLRYRLRKLMVIQEDGRQKFSLHLRNEIAQLLLALDIRLLALKGAGIGTIRKLTREIAETEGLVRQSSKTLTRLAHDSKTQK